MFHAEDKDPVKKEKKNGSEEKWGNCLRNIPVEESTDGI